MTSPTFADLLRARERLEGKVIRTPLRNDPGLDAALGCRAWLKCENLQEGGAFKLRGATNAVAHLREQGLDGDVATHSSGNHGAALALAARRDGRRACVVMPRDAVPTKIAAVRACGGEVLLCEPGQKPREEGLASLVAQGFIPVPPYDHADIIAGQGTAAMEMLEQHPGLEAVITPVGGGGLLAGTALAVHGMQPGAAIYGAEPEGAADTHASLQRGSRVTDLPVNTMADGLRAVVGISNLAIIRELVREVLLVSEPAILAAMQLVFRHLGMAIEPSSAVAVAAVQANPGLFAQREVGIIISGGNLDRAAFPWLDGHD